MNSLNPLLILTGKTASGKDTVMYKLLDKFPNWQKIITTTSRLPRSGETNGIDYNFITEADFRKKIETGDFIEYVKYAGYLYGTEKDQILSNFNMGLIWRIDPSRAGEIKEFISSTFDKNLAQELLKRVLVIYLTVDDTVVLQRLQERGIKKEEIEARMSEDRKFWEDYKDQYDFVVENAPGKLDETIDKIVGIIQRK